MKTAYLYRPYGMVEESKRRFLQKQRKRLKPTVVNDEGNNHLLARFFPECREKASALEEKWNKK